MMQTLGVWTIWPYKYWCRDPYYFMSWRPSESQPRTEWDITVLVDANVSQLNDLSRTTRHWSVWPDQETSWVNGIYAPGLWASRCP